MNYQFVFIGFDKQNIDNKSYLCIYLLEMEKKSVFRIFKPYNDDNYDKLSDLNLFSDVSSYIHFVIKRDGKISLNIDF